VSMGRYAGKHCEHGVICRQMQSIYADQQASTPVVLSDKREHRIVGLINGRSDKVQLRKIDNTPVSVSMHTHLQHAKHPCTTSPTVPAARLYHGEHSSFASLNCSTVCSSLCEEPLWYQKSKNQKWYKTKTF